MVFDRVKEILCDQLDVEPEKVTMDSLIADDLGADSLDVVEVIMSLEDEFGIEVPDEAVKDVRTVGDVVNYIEEHQN
ncbi:MAG: acyl carrier protein [Oscillospiraceae bacterium]|nr:acyl carrier protein [Oscillospiraceae bacterium]MBQ4102268.1 acyl carrier protein [Oscillospiraceae bacterium]